MPAVAAPLANMVSAAIPHSAMDRESLRRQGIDIDRPLAIPQLANVEVPLAAVEPECREPAEEDVARGLHQPLSLDHALAMSFERARPRVWLQHRSRGLLRLHEQRVLSVAAHHQHDPGMRPDTSDADDLPGQVDESVAVEQVLAIALEAVAIAAKYLAHPVPEVQALIPGEELAHGDDQRRIADDPRLAVFHSDQAIEGLQAVLLLRLRDALPRSLEIPGAGDLGQFGQQQIDVEARVPDVEVAHPGELPHCLAVRADGGEDRGAGVLWLQATVATGDAKACGKALDVPFPRSGERLVEVVQVPHQTAVGGGEDAEIGEMGIAAELYPQA
jgi:hypothetical protein